MIIDESAKKALIYVLVGVAIFVIFKPKDESDNTAQPLQKAVNSSGRVHLIAPNPNSVTVFNESLVDNGMICVNAFISAYNNGESEVLLTDLNNEMKDNYGLYLIKKSTNITVYDINNNKVLEAKI
jgi:hypothetical protein